MKNKSLNQQTLSIAISIFLLGASTALAQTSTSALNAQSTSAPMVKVGFVENIKSTDSKPTISWNGDLRYRQQNETDNTSDERKRQRLQARLGMIAQVQNDLKVNFRMMTGAGATSGNQDLGEGGGMPRRNFGIDQAYATYTPASWSDLYAGRMQQPFVFAGKSQIFWDRDISPEGLAVHASPFLAESFMLQVNAGSFWIKENYSAGMDTPDVMMNGGQVLVGYRLDRTTFSIVFSNFGYTNVKELKPTDIVSGGSFKGNSADASLNYSNAYEISQIGAEIKGQLSSYDWSIYAESTKNTKASSENTATAVGANILISDFNLSLIQQTIQKDAVLSLFTDGDFANGNVSSRGTIASLAYNFTKQVTASAAIYDNQYEIETANSKTYRRSQLDLLIKF